MKIGTGNFSVLTFRGFVENLSKPDFKSFIKIFQNTRVRYRELSIPPAGVFTPKNFITPLHYHAPTRGAKSSYNSVRGLFSIGYCSSLYTIICIRKRK